MTGKVAILGDVDTSVGFRLAGILKAVTPTDAQSARSALVDFFRDPDVSLIIITEPFAEQIRDTVEELSSRPYPVIVEIPDKRGHLKEKASPLRRLVKRSIGVELEGF
jgi:V/A-type H+-transporting ATPase subunit F